MARVAPAALAGHLERETSRALRIKHGDGFRGSKGALALFAAGTWGGGRRGEGVLECGIGCFPLLAVG